MQTSICDDKTGSVDGSLRYSNTANVVIYFGWSHYDVFVISMLFLGCYIIFGQHDNKGTKKRIWNLELTHVEQEHHIDVHTFIIRSATTGTLKRCIAVINSN